ncbi:MAG TPA: acyl-CoA dehydrogenase family protein [Chloroflexota bacterium]|nr:acyl-CoA dehydrogenase family protein [Chloroflexota bacterium]
MASSDVVTVPSVEELAARAEALLPRLRERAARAEELRRVPDETIAEFREAGFFRLFQPARYGGYELDYGPVQLALGSVLGRACGSSAWVQSVVACHAWLLGMFPLAAQDAVWGEDPETLLSTAISMQTGIARPVAGGYEVTGHWEFSSGVDAVQWVMVFVPVEAAAGPPPMRCCVLPRADWQIVDNWYATGLRGTGSKDVVIEGAFVPEERAVGLDLLGSGRGPGGALPDAAYIYRLPLFPVFPYNLVGPALGIARGAVEEYVAQTMARPDRLNLATRHLRIAESAAEVDAAEALLRADATEITRLGAASESIPLETCVRWLRNLAFAAVLCQRAADRLATAASAHSVLEPSPLQRASRDLHAIVSHVGVCWDQLGVSYGRVRVGLDHGNPFLGPASAHA